MDGLAETLSKLSQLDGPSGYEDEVRKFLVHRAEEYTGEVETDVLGNVYATVRGESDAQKVIVDAHMDEVGSLSSISSQEDSLGLNP